MSENNNVKGAFLLAAVLLVVGIVCYAASGPQLGPGEEPVRKVFKGLAGDVLFDHQGHTANESDCSVCHHHGDSGEMACDVCHKDKSPEMVPAACNDCHPLSDDADVYDAHHPLDAPGDYACVDCHQKKEGQTLPDACGDCHDPDDAYYAEEADRIQMNYEKASDAIHSQCIGCHKDLGSGPVECGSCHAQ